MKRLFFILFCLLLAACTTSKSIQGGTATSIGNSSSSQEQIEVFSVTAQLTPPYNGKKIMDATMLLGDGRFVMRIDPSTDASLGSLNVTLFDVNGGQLPVFTQISLQKAHCVAYTYDGTFPKLYLDGKLAEAPGGGPIHFAEAGSLSIDSPSIVSHVQVSSGVLSPADLAKNCQ